LDYHYTDKNSDKLSPETIQKQKELFILQCKLAQEYEI
jgi:Tat protein secretion system quality control protein TatD with DNase activity